jgi:hypothetical protein
MPEQEQNRLPGESARTVGRIAIGLVVALVAAGVVTVPRIFGIDTWKWVLGGLGLALFVAAGRRRTS